MKSFFALPALFLLFSLSADAQQPDMHKPVRRETRQQLLAGASFPTGAFSRTHTPGITISYNRIPGNERVGPGVIKRQTRWFTAASLSHFTGRKETAGAGTFSYNGYSLFDVQGGLHWSPFKKSGISLGTGPALGYYKHVFRFTYTGTFQVSYQAGKKINITPGLSLFKEIRSDALWVTRLQLGYQF